MPNKKRDSPFRLPRHKAEGRIRTDGLLITNELLCQLSYFGNSEI
jgi:hypothetical protein